MRPRPEKRRLAGCLAVAAIALATAAAAGGAGEPTAPAELWRSAFEARPQIDVGGRMVVVLAAPSLADRVRATGELPPAKIQRRLVRRADGFQERLVAALRAQGVDIVRERSYVRTFNGFSAVLDARALAALETAPGVVGVYPVRPVYPASVSASVLDRAGFEATGGRRPGVTLTGFDGSGVTIALLDTGVDRGHPSLRGKVARGLDLVDGAGGGIEPEAHGTRMAGLLVGSEPLSGVAPGASIVPIRVLAPALDAGVLGYAGRSDVLLAGLERAVDPDGNGDVEDAADVALAALVEPYASFADAPEARAIAGAVDLGTLVVAAAGNDGPAGGGFGTVGSPGGAPSALTVGAVDARAETHEVDLTVTAGGEDVWEGSARVLGAVVPENGTFGRAEVAALPADGTPLAPRVRAAAAKGAVTVLVYGSGLPAGVLDLDERAAVPVVALPLWAGERVAEAIGNGWQVSVELGGATPVDNARAGRVAPFSSRGPALGGHAKPDLVAAGVGIVTADAGRAPGTGYATVTGTSAAAAAVAGAAALVAQARPDLDARGIASALVSRAQRLADEPATAQGAGLLDVVAAAEAVLATEPATLALGQLRPQAPTVKGTLVLRNVSGKRLRVQLSAEGTEGAARSLGVEPRAVTLRPGERREVTVSVTAGTAGGAGVFAGAVVARSDGDEVARVPWLATVVKARPRLVRIVDLSSPSSAPSDRSPAVLTFRAGRISGEAGALSIDPVALLEVELLNAGGKRVGLLARLRDLLPGEYTIGLTGRGPAGAKLVPGRYVVRLRARSADSGEGLAAYTSTASVPFSVPRS